LHQFEVIKIDDRISHFTKHVLKTVVYLLVLSNGQPQPHPVNIYSIESTRDEGGMEEEKEQQKNRTTGKKTRMELVPLSQTRLLRARDLQHF
jgi:hypothetical protein